MKTKLLIALLIVVSVGALYAFSSIVSNNSEGEQEDFFEQEVCTLEVKVCPDGSEVGRIPPTCEFAPCPQEREDEVEVMKPEDRREENAPVSQVEGNNDIDEDEEAIPYCTPDARECPDGSFVFRGGPECEFTPCPGLYGPEGGSE